jgi:hypothetical protein
MKNFITCNNYNSNYKYIILSFIFYISNDIIFGFNYNESCRLFKILKGNFINNNKIIYHLFCYFGTFLISALFFNIEKRRLRSETINFSSSQPKKKTQIELIYQDVNNDLDIYNSKFYFFFFLLIIFLWIFVEQGMIFYNNVFKHLDFWMVELLIISYLNSKMFKLKMFKHQKFVIWFNLLPIIFKIFTIIICFHDENNRGADDFKYQKEESETYNIESLKVLYVVYTWLTPIGIVLYLAFITLRSYVNIKIKWFIDLKYISPNKFLMLYGMMGAFFSVFVCIITTFVPCEESPDVTKKDIYDYVCTVKEGDKRYITNLLIYFKAFGQLSKRTILYEIITIVFGVITFFFYKRYSILTIQYLTPVHMIFSFPIYFFSEKFLLIINDLILEHKFFVHEIYNIGKIFICDTSGDILSFFGFLIYLEIIELHCWGLNKDLRNQIIERGIHESHFPSDSDLENNTFNTSEEEDGSISKKGTNDLNTIN